MCAHTVLRHLGCLRPKKVCFLMDKLKTKRGPGDIGLIQVPPTADCRRSICNLAMVEDW